MGFSQSQVKTSLFIFQQASHTIFLLLYVDDIVVTGSDFTHPQQFISLLGGHFDIKDLGPLSYFLGLQVLHKDGPKLASSIGLKGGPKAYKLPRILYKPNKILQEQEIKINLGREVSTPPNYELAEECLKTNHNTGILTVGASPEWRSYRPLLSSSRSDTFFNTYR
ncbi:unnamed protein product [Prunus brigantina]